MPILGTIASSYPASALSSSFYSLQTVTVTGSTASSIDFTSIPSTYKHLQIRITARSIYTTDAISPYLRFNSDSGSNYPFRQVYFDSSNSGTTAQTNTAVIASQLISALNSSSSSNFSPVIIDILDYANTNKFKPVRSVGGWYNSANNNYQWQYRGAVWTNTNAISSINISADGGSFSARNFEIGSTFALYGIKGA